MQGPLYTRSQGQCSTQNPAFLLVQKLKSAPRAFTLGVKAKMGKKKFSICPKLLINAEIYGLVLLAPRLEKGYHQIWEANLQPLGPMFQHFFSNLGPICNPKMLKVGPKYFPHIWVNHKIFYRFYSLGF